MTNVTCPRLREPAEVPCDVLDWQVVRGDCGLVFNRNRSNCSGYYLEPGETYLFRVKEKCEDSRAEGVASMVVGPLQTMMGVIDSISLTVLDPTNRRFIVAVPLEHKILSINLDFTEIITVLAGESGVCGFGLRCWRIIVRHPK